MKADNHFYAILFLHIQLKWIFVTIFIATFIKLFKLKLSFMNRSYYKRETVHFFLTLPAFFFLIIFSGCKKTTLEQTVDDPISNVLLLSERSIANSLPVTANGYCVTDQEAVSSPDSVLKPTILGAKLTGFPYSVATMQQAYLSVYGNSTQAVENALYMRFKPATFDQLATLEDQDIDLFDYPLDYEVVQEGDYYDDGVTNSESIPWLYAVVPVNFVTPSGITGELLQRIHVPDDYRVENKAFQLTGNNVDTADCASAVASTSACDCSVRPSALSCNCRVQCGFDPCITPPPPVPNTRIPAGGITVQEDIFQPNVPIRQARMVARRFLKVARTFTDNNGRYTFSKSFRNKVSIFIKFKNSNAIIMGLRGARLWQILFPVKIKMGTYRGNINNLDYNVTGDADVRSRSARHWAAATMHNKVQEYRDYSTLQGIMNPPDKLRVLCVPGNSGGSTPMFAKRFIANLPESFIRQYIVSAFVPPIFQSITALAEVLVNRVDMTIGYKSPTSNISRKNSAQMSELGYHELTHAGHYAKVGNAWWSNFVNAEISQIIANFGGQYSPYGQSNSADAPIIALGESWAYHIGHFLTNSRYGTQSPQFIEQGIGYTNGNPAATLNSNLNLLEDFNPRRTVNDPFWWIPQGLYYDLIDNRNDLTVDPLNVRVPLDDSVIGYTNSQFFNALDADIDNLPAYRVRLLNENANNQAAGVNTIFTFYGY